MNDIRVRLAIVLPDRPLAIARYIRCHGTLPNLLRPRSFNEKVLHRILFERHDWMRTLADKYAVRDHVRARLGPQLLPELYHVTADPETIPFDRLPDRFVVKPTHGSGWVEIVRDSSRLDRARLRRLCRSWLRQSYYAITREWIYKDIPRRILVEELIDDGTGSTPADYKLFVFGGRVAFILVTLGRFEARAHALMDRDWQPVDVRFVYSADRRATPPPPHLAQMIEAAEILSDGRDFIRADFYDTAAKLYFGELTVTPGCGLDRFEPASFDYALGALWKQAEAAGGGRRRRQPLRLARVRPQ